MYYETSPGVFQGWGGERLANGVLYPFDIRETWTDEALATVGLFRPAEAIPIPPGKTPVGRKVERVDGIVRFVDELVDLAPPLSAPVVEVSAVQAKTALYGAGLFDAVEAAISAHPYALMRIWWASAQFWRRDHPYVAGMAAEMDLDEAQVDQLFAAAQAVPT